MTDTELFGVPKPERERFERYQSRVFFSKADGAYPPEIGMSHLETHRNNISDIFKQTLQTDIHAIEELPRRTLHYVYRVRTPGKSYILRINACGAFYREFQFAIERWVTETLRSRGIPTIAVHAVDISRSVTPFDYEILDDAGESIFDRSKGAGIDGALVTRLGAFLAGVHGIETRNFGPFDISLIAASDGVGIHTTWVSYISLNAERHLESCLMAGIMTPIEVEESSRILSHANGLTVEQPVLLHGDIAHHNAFTDGTNITSLIDWEDCVSGDPVFDLAYYATGCFGNDPWYTAFIDGYRNVRPLPSDFDRRFPIYYLRIAIAKALVRERFGTAASVHLPHTTDRIRFAIAQAKEHGL